MNVSAPSQTVKSSNYSTRQALIIYTIFQLAFSLLLWTPIFYEYQKISGLSDYEIFRIQSIYYVIFLLCEIPTGALADRLGYRLSLKLGAWVLLASNLLPIFWTSYAGFLTQFATLALARSLISGASSAWLYEFMKERGEPNAYKQLEGRTRAATLIGRVVGWAPMGMAMAWHPAIPYWATAACSLMAIVYVYRLPPLALEKSEQSERGSMRTEALLNAIPKLVTQLRTQPYLLMVMVQGISIFVLARIVMINLFQPILKSAGMSVASFGWLMAGMSLVEALGSWHPAWIRRWVSDLTAVWMLTLLISLSLIPMAYGGVVGVVIGFSLFSLAFGFAFPIQKQLMNDTINNPKQRASLLSIESLIDRAVCSIAVLPIGHMVAGQRMGELLLWAALGSMLVTTLVWGFARNMRHKTAN